LGIHPLRRDLTFQQVQKYEKGQNRVGAGRLREIARLLEVPVSAFFEDRVIESTSRRIWSSSTWT
jgi:transcriptional regulator with XRE-family HTH domain